ncbi:MAG: DUF6544 family protein [Tunicatimonas sp.]
MKRKISLTLSLLGTALIMSVLMLRRSHRQRFNQLETKRYLTADRLETWIGELADYRRINNVLVPTRIQATWKLAEGDHTYVDFRVKAIAYN